MGWNHQPDNHPNIAQYTMYLIHLCARDFVALFLQRLGPAVVALKENSFQINKADQAFVSKIRGVILIDGMFGVFGAMPWSKGLSRCRRRRCCCGFPKIVT